MPARDMAKYMRDRRAKQRAERGQSSPPTARQIIDRRVAQIVVDAAIPPGALLKERPHELDAALAKADTLGPGAVITKIGGRLTAITRAQAEARDPSHYTPPPRSMTAIGGRPGRGLVPQSRGYAAPPDLAAVSPYTRFEEFQAQTKTMLRTLAARVDAQDRHILELDRAVAEGKANGVNIGHVIAGLFSYAARR
jgi:hypothetical protein